MIFAGTTFCGGSNALSYTPTNVSNINLIQIQNGVFDELRITKDVAFAYTLTIPQNWDFHTVFHALFQNNLSAGNIKYTAEQVSLVRVKRRETGTYQWLTLFEIPIRTLEDFKFIRYDPYARSEVQYDYACVPVVNNVEGNINMNTVKSEFDGIYLIDKDQTFSTILDVETPVVQRNKTTNVINTINSKYPYVIQNGSNDYDSITLSATFIDYDYEQHKWKSSGSLGTDYRVRLSDFLNNGKVKILKIPYTGQIWMVSSVDVVAHAENGHPERIKTTMQFVEVGDVNSSNDMYNNGFIDVNIENS